METVADPPVPPTEPRRRFGTRVQLVVLGLNVVFWGAILGWTWFADHPYDPPDHLDDPAFATAAEPICAAAVVRIEALGLPTTAQNPTERADLVDASNEILRAMVDDLAALPRPAGEEGSWVTQWLADWRTHIGDRQRWADGLRAGRDVPFSETARAQEQISKVVDNFATVNEKPSCQTTHDV